MYFYLLQYTETFAYLPLADSVVVFRYLIEVLPHINDEYVEAIAGSSLFNQASRDTTAGEEEEEQLQMDSLPPSSQRKRCIVL